MMDNLPQLLVPKTDTGVGIAKIFERSTAAQAAESPKRADLTIFARSDEGESPCKREKLSFPDDEEESEKKCEPPPPRTRADDGKERLLDAFRKQRETLIFKIRETCRYERDCARKKTNEWAEKLGYIRMTVDMKEVWMDGREILELKKRISEVNEERETNKRDKRKPRKRGREAVKIDDELEASSYQLMDIVLKKELDELEMKLTTLEREKLTYIKELKRIQYEDRSRWNEMRILGNRYLLEKLVGKGGFSEVYRAYDLEENRTVAVKMHQLSSEWSQEKKENYYKHATREFQIQKGLNHPRVVKLYDMINLANEECQPAPEEYDFATVLEFCPSDLDDYLKKSKQQTLAEPEAKHIMIQILSALKYLSELNERIIHYDLKPGNILFTKQMEVKISDFGLSKIMPEQATNIELTSQGCGTFWYLPPECFKKDTQICNKVDVWAAGIVFFQMLYGKKAFGNDQPQAAVPHAVQSLCEVVFPANPKISEEAKKIIRKMLTPSPIDRPDVQTIYNDDYFHKKKKTAIPQSKRENGIASAKKLPGSDNSNG